jgi:MFS family permease
MTRLARHPAFRLLFAGYLTSIAGDRALFVVLGIWTLDLTGSTAAGGLAFGFLAVAGFAAPLAGVVADRFPRRAVLIGNDLATAALVLCLLAVHDADGIWIVYAVALGYGFSQQVGAAARGAFVAGMVPDDLLPTANGLLEAARSGIRIVAPVVGAGLYLLAGGHAVAVLDAATFAVSAACLWRVVAPDRAGQRGRLQRSELAAGLRHLLATPDLRAPLPWLALGAAGIGASEVIPFAVVHDGLGRGSAFLGVLGACHGAGAIAGGIGAARVIDRRGELAAAIGGCLAGSLAMVLFAVPAVPAALLGSAALGVAIATVMVAWGTLVARRTPAALRGRAAAASELMLSTPYVGTIALAAGAVALVDFRVVSLVGAATLGLAALRLRRSLAAPRASTASAAA